MHMQTTEEGRPWHEGGTRGRVRRGRRARVGWAHAWALHHSPKTRDPMKTKSAKKQSTKKATKKVFAKGLAGQIEKMKSWLPMFAARIKKHEGGIARTKQRAKLVGEQIAKLEARLKAKGKPAAKPVAKAASKPAA